MTISPAHSRGGNLPIYHNHKIIAVIGITGNPDDVQKYARLAERITRLLIREKELDAFNRTESEKKSYILRGLIDHEDIHSDNRPVLSASLDNAVSQLFKQLDCQLFTFVYPDEYLAVIKEAVFHRMQLC